MQCNAFLKRFLCGALASEQKKTTTKRIKIHTNKQIIRFEFPLFFADLFFLLLIFKHISSESCTACFIFTAFHVRTFALCMLNILGMLMLRNISQSILCSFALVMYDFVRWQHFITALSMLFMSQLTWICTVHTGKDRFRLFNMSYHRHKMSSMQCFIPKKRMAHKIVFGCAACLANTKPCCNLIGEPCSFELNFIHQNRIVLSHSRQIGPISVLRIRFFFFVSALRSCISCSIPDVETENRKMQEDNR